MDTCSSVFSLETECTSDLGMWSGDHIQVIVEWYLGHCREKVVMLLFPSVTLWTVEIPGKILLNANVRRSAFKFNL